MDMARNNATIKRVTNWKMYEKEKSNTEVKFCFIF